jgi:UDP-N-acetylmuramate: L-alanyl-gamma-D-glutamyl-meso-diaminopimelate ligase
MSSNKHIHLIGICGTAMAALAGMLAERGFRVTGSDTAAYPPMSDFLNSLGIPVAQPFKVENLNSTPDLVVVGNAISRGNVELEHVLDRRIPFCSLPQLLHDEFLRGKEVLVVAGTHGKTDNLNTFLDLRVRRYSSIVPDRWNRREFRPQLSVG